MSELKCKVIVIGDSAVGKTTFISRLIDRFEENAASTFGVSYVTKEIKETDKENESKKDIEIDDDDFPLEKYQQRRGRGKSHHIKNKMESMSVFKGILTKDSKKIKKQNFEIEKDNDKNIKIDEKKEEDENKVSNDELNKTKSKEKKKGKKRR